VLAEIRRKTKALVFKYYKKLKIKEGKAVK
jgi:hypothetical protein